MNLTKEELDLTTEIGLWRRELGVKTPRHLKVRRASMGLNAGRQVYQLLGDLGVSRIFEVGTCVGIGAVYMCLGAEKNGPVNFIGMEGVEAKRELALETLAKFTRNTTYEVVPGFFQDNFDDTVEYAKPLEFAYIDGRHKKSPTINMFNKCVDAMPAGGWIMVDDLRSTHGMNQAGKIIRQQPRIENRQSFYGKELFKIREEN